MFIIRQEKPADFDAVRQVVKEAFAAAEHTDGDEHNLVGRLRQSRFFIPAWPDLQNIFPAQAGIIPVCSAVMNTRSGL